MMQYAAYDASVHDLCVFIKKKSSRSLRLLLVGSVAQNSSMSLKNIDVQHHKKKEF